MRQRLLSTFAKPLVLLALLAGCGSKQSSDIAAQPAAPLPSYGLGDSYQFSDGSSDAIASIVDGRIRWQAKNGSFVTGRDVLLPRLAWTDGRSSGERHYVVGPVELFPLEPGKGVKFTATRSVTPFRSRQPIVVQEDWRCNVAGSERTAAPAGTFDTWRVDCTMRETPPVIGDGVVQRTLWYAPAIGYYVRYEERDGGGPPRAAELTGYTTSDAILPDSALRQRSTRLQHALEREPSGTQANWSDPRTGDAGIVTLVDTRRSEQYGWCRDFSELIRSTGRVYSLHGIGCRDPAKVWNIVMLAPGAPVH